MKAIGVIVGCAVLGLVIAVAGLLCWAAAARLYSAEAVLGVHPPSQGHFALGAGPPEAGAMDRLVATQTHLALSESVLDRATKDVRVTSTGWYQRNRERAMAELTDRLQAEPIPQTDLIRLSMTGPAETERDQVELAEIVNAVADAFVSDSRERLRMDLRERISALQVEQANLTDRLDRLRREIMDINRMSRVGDVREEARLQGARLESLGEEISRLTRQLDASRSPGPATATAPAEQPEAPGRDIREALVSARTEYNAHVAALRDLQPSVKALEQLAQEEEGLSQERQRITARIADMRIAAQESPAVSLRLIATAARPLSIRRRMESLPAETALLAGALGAVVGLAVGVVLAAVGVGRPKARAVPPAPKPTA